MGECAIANYINNKRLLAELIEHKRKLREAEVNNKPKPEISRYLAEAIMAISEKLSLKSQFIGYTYREDMIADGIVACVKYIDCFNPEKSSNPFAYITTIIYNAFINRLNLEHKERYVKAVSMKQSNRISSEEDEFSDDSIDSTINSFELKMLKRKEKAAARNKKKEEAQFD